MRVPVSLLLIVLASAGCGQRESIPTPAVPPPMPDRVSELRDYGSVSPDARANPAPDPSMLTCYSVTLSPEDPSLPAVIALTSEPKGTIGLHQLYAVAAKDGTRSPFWSWRPYTKDEIRITLGGTNGGWTVSLRRTPDGFEGTAVMIMDSMERRERTARLTQVACAP